MPAAAMYRRDSTPLMQPFMTSAPGKVIVFGEHAVVHGKNAMAASISLRSYLLVTSLSKLKRIVTLRFPDIDLDHTWKIDELPWHEFSKPGKKKYYYDLVPDLDPELLAAITPHADEAAAHAPHEMRKVHHAAALSFLYLFLSLGSQSFPGCIYTLRSTLPVGAGLGSSASVNVCLASALLLQIHALSGPHPDQPIDESRLQVERINRWAFVGEVCIHEKPSGVDNTVISGGKAVVFKREDYRRPPSVTHLWNFSKLPLILTNTRQSRSTAAQVAKVSHLIKTHPSIAESILSTIDNVSVSARRAIEYAEDDTKMDDEVRTMGELFNVNHGLLAALGVSHPKLERVRELVDSHNAGWTKLTGAGGGGCAITLINPAAPPEEILKLEASIDAEGFERYDTYLGGEGVGVLWPQVTRSGEALQKGIEEIDEDSFFNTRERGELEKLVGIESGKSWRFWR